MPVAVLQPNKSVSARTYRMLVFGWMLLGLLVWSNSPYAILPTPVEVFRAFPALLSERALLPNLGVSFLTSLQALAIVTTLSLGLAYLSVVPVIRPLVTGLSNVRYLGFAGVTMLFTLMLNTSHRIKVALLVFGISGFFLKSMHDVVCGLKRSQFSYPRTLGMSEWRVVWLTVVRGTLPEAWDILRQNAAMTWMLLTIVETLHRTEGGIGVMLANGEKHLDYASMVGIQITIFATGLAQDAVIGFLKRWTCPHVGLSTERKES